MMADKGVHAALPHPRFGMDRRLYLEEPFWKAMDATIDEAQKVGSSIWLYDEYNWPSGGAGGRVTDGHPEFYPRGLDYTFVECEGPRDFTISKPAASEKVMERFEKIVAAFIAPGGDAIPREPWGQIDPRVNPSPALCRAGRIVSSSSFSASAAIPARWTTAATP